MRREDAPLEDAIAEYAAEAQMRLKPATLRTYLSYLNLFAASLGHAELRHLTPPHVKNFAAKYAADGKIHAAHNATIALKALSTYLAKEGVFFGPGGLPTLIGVEIPSVPKTSRPAYTPEEVIEIEKVIATQPNASILSAIHWLQLGTGIRANETRLLRLCDVILPAPQNEYQGHIIVREDTTKTAAGAREIPLDQRAAKAIRRYLGDGRARYLGDGAEPLFLTDEGYGFTEAGWHKMHQRLRRELENVASRDTSSTATATRGRATRSRPACPRRRSCKWAAGGAWTCSAGTTASSVRRSFSVTRRRSPSTSVVS